MSYVASLDGARNEVGEAGHLLLADFPLALVKLYIHLILGVVKHHFLPFPDVFA